MWRVSFKMFLRGVLGLSIDMTKKARLSVKARKFTDDKENDYDYNDTTENETQKQRRIK
jgi:hypothetical protein